MYIFYVEYSRHELNWIRTLDSIAE